MPHLATYISLFSVNQDWVFTGIDPGMAFTPFPCSIWKRRDSNLQPFGCEPSSLTTTPSSHSCILKIFYTNEGFLKTWGSISFNWAKLFNILIECETFDKRNVQQRFEMKNRWQDDASFNFVKMHFKREQEK